MGIRWRLLAFRRTQYLIFGIPAIAQMLYLRRKGSHGHARLSQFENVYKGRDHQILPRAQDPGVENCQYGLGCEDWLVCQEYQSGTASCHAATVFLLYISASFNHHILK
jgi:hypothetical protein